MCLYLVHLGKVLQIPIFFNLYEDFSPRKWKFGRTERGRLKALLSLYIINNNGVNF